MTAFNAFGAGSTPQDVSYLLQNTKTPQPVADGFDESKLDAIPWQELRSSWLEIDLGAIRNNTVVARRALSAGTRLCAVVKADGYGHGSVPVAKTALAAGAAYLAVATVPEGVELRKAGIVAPILVLSEPPATAAAVLLHYHLLPSVYTSEFAIAYAEVADSAGMSAPFHLAVNTGMNRIGVRYDQVIDFLRAITFHRALKLEGTFTHFATADCPEEFDFALQFRRFQEVIATMRQFGIDPGLVHCANSAALLRYPKTHMDMARLGISLYGPHPCEETRPYYDLRPAMSLHARITAVNTPPMSEGVSYGMHYRSLGSVKICALSVGYADGFPRALSGQTSVIYNGRLCRQVGNICMDQCMFEVDMRLYGSSSRLDPQVGDEVILMGSQNGACVPIEELAARCGTIPHEIMCALALRLPRVYR